VRQPSLLVIGMSAFSMVPRRPPSAPTRVVITISPPGRQTRANSSSAHSGRGTAVTTYCATTTSKESSGKSSASASPTSIASTLPSFSRSTRSRAFSSIGSEISMPISWLDAAYCGKRNARADANLEDAPADLFGRAYGSGAPLPKDGTEHEIINRRPTPISLGDARCAHICRRGHLTPQSIEQEEFSGECSTPQERK